MTTIKYAYKCPKCNEIIPMLQRTTTKYSFVLLKPGLFGKPIFVEDTGSDEDYFDICPKCSEEIEADTLIIIEL